MSEQAAAAAPARQAAAPERGARPGLMLQRKCDCGQHTVDGGECAECRKKRLAVQRWPSDRPRPDPAARTSDASSAWAEGSGMDLSHVPAQAPALRTAPRVQRVPDGAQPATLDAAPEEAVEEAEAPAQSPGPASPESAPPEAPSSGPEAEAASDNAAREAGGALLVDDDAADVAGGQMRKAEFLDRLESAVCAQADEALAAAGRSTEGCPYLSQAFGHYRGKSAAQVESGLRRYAPETRNARTAEEYIPIVAARVRQGVERWVSTGEISGVPEGMSLPGGGVLGALGGLGGGLMGSIGGMAAGIGSLLFKADEGGARPADDPAAVHEELGAGRPLESGVRGRMERAFGRGFSGVRMHTDATAGRLSREQNARAFAVGGHVAFAAGEYRPGTPAGDALIAHELAHTVQQGGGPAATQAKSASEAGYGALEADADRSAVGVVARLWGGAKDVAGAAAINAGPALRSGLSLQRCSKNKTKTNTPGEQPAQVPPKPEAPGDVAAPAKTETQPEPVKPPPEPVDPEPAEWCAKESDEAGLIALLKKAGAPAPVGTLAYGFTWWNKAKTARLPKLSISYTGTAADKLTGKVEPTTTSMGTMEALYLKAGTHEVPGKKFNVIDSQCGPDGKRVPLFSAVSDEMSLLARRAEQEHCNDYRRAFELSYVKEAANINSLVGTPFGPGTKAQVRAMVEKALEAKGDKGHQGWVDEVNRLARISQTVRDDGQLHRLKPDGDPKKVDAACTRQDATTVKATTTKVPGPRTVDIIK